ncbi:MAG: hypothetical protein M1822_006034 [Bathelium mastoideum]|nr:MAG: hypothetical protein M1822_006034 [Bathelium mastoideum]
MADRIAEDGSKVIAVGRRQSRLDAFINKHGKDKASSVVFDISDRNSVDKFVSDVTKQYPDLDCVFLNAGTQSQINLAQPAKVDLKNFHDEININFNSFVDISMKFLPFLMNKNSPSGIIFTGTHLAIVPAAPLPAYSASKAALSSFILCLRAQLEAQNSQVKIVEILPPLVQTELHDYLGEDKGRSMGMPLAEFTDQAYKGLTSGSDQVAVGAVGQADLYNDVLNKRRTVFENLAKMMRGMFPKN